MWRWVPLRQNLIMTVIRRPPATALVSDVIVHAGGVCAGGNSSWLPLPQWLQPQPCCRACGSSPNTMVLR